MLNIVFFSLLTLQMVFPLPICALSIAPPPLPENFTLEKMDQRHSHIPLFLDEFTHYESERLYRELRVANKISNEVDLEIRKVFNGTITIENKLKHFHYFERIDFALALLNNKEIQLYPGLKEFLYINALKLHRGKPEEHVQFAEKMI